MVPTLIDAIVLALLIGTIGYAWLLDRRVRALMEVLREMKPMVGAFSDAVDRSSQSIETLRELSAKAPVVEQKPSVRRERAAPASSKPSRRAMGKAELVRTFFDMTKEDAARADKDRSV